MLLGTVAGYFGGWIDELVVWLYSTFDSMPTLLFILAELFWVKDPVVHLRVFKNKSFAAGSSVMFITFFVLFGTIVIIPIYLQKLMGYNAYLAGLAVGFWKDSGEIKRCWKAEKIFIPKMAKAASQKLYESWLEAVKRTIYSV